MTPTVREPERTLPVVDSADVAVIGGGIAGCAAALASARTGASTILVEKMCNVGGLATLGNVIVYLPLCDGEGRQVIGGLGEELLKLSVRTAPERIPECWRSDAPAEARCAERYQVRFNPARFALELEALLVDEGVRLHYDTRFCTAIKKENRIDAIVVENKSGRGAIAARTVIDATGDADVCHAAGEPVATLPTNVLAGWFYHTDGAEVKLYPMSKPFDENGAAPPEGIRGYAGHRAEEVTQFVLDANADIRRALDRLNAESSAPVEPVVLPTAPNFRMTRRLKGAVELERAHAGAHFDDAIGQTGDWRRAGPVYAIPWRALVATKTDNLITAGRCISAASAWDVTRAIPACAVTGEAAGVAAGLAAKQGLATLSDLAIALLQTELKRRGVLLPGTATGNSVKNIK